MIQTRPIGVCFAINKSVRFTRYYPMLLYLLLHDQADDVDNIMAILMDACKPEEDVS